MDAANDDDKDDFRGRFRHFIPLGWAMSFSLSLSLLMASSLL